MNTIPRTSLAVLFGALLMAGAALAGPSRVAQAQPTAAPGATLIPLDNALYNVAEGVFQVQEGQTVDLTDQNVIFMFKRGQRKDEQARCFTNGSSDRCGNGVRLNFKTRQVGGGCCISNVNPARFEAKDRCFLDVVRITAPKGAPATGVFRLNCL